MKKETLEEDITKRRLKMTDGGLLSSCLSKNIDTEILTTKEIINIYKSMKDYSIIKLLQQERSYSDEDIREAFRQGQDNMKYDEIYGFDTELTEQDWFNKFKKK